MNLGNHEAEKIRKRYVCPWVHAGVSCDKEYANAFGTGALKHFHKDLVNVCCTGELTVRRKFFAMLEIEKGIMKTLKKKGLVISELVAA